MSDPRRAMIDETPNRPAARRRLTGGLAVGLAVALLCAGGTTLALFSSQATASLRTIIAGDLDLTMGELTWEQITESVPPDKRVSGTASEVPDGFWSMPGDVFTIQVPVTTVLQGDNLEADLEITVDYTPGDDQPIVASYHVEATSGEATNTSEQPIGQPTAISGLLGSSAPGVTARVEANWTVVLTVTVQPEHQWVDPYRPETPEPRQWSAGTVTASLKQVRPWEGGGR